MAPVGNLAVQETADNSFVAPSLTNPPCQHCGKGTVNWRARWPEDCQKAAGGLVQLTVSPGCTYRSETLVKLKQQILDSELPKDEFASLHLAIDNATLWRYLRGETISDPKIRKIRATESVWREGGYLHTVTRVQESSRWTSMLLRRKREGGI